MKLNKNTYNAEVVAYIFRCGVTGQEVKVEAKDVKSASRGGEGEFDSSWSFAWLEFNCPCGLRHSIEIADGW